MRVAVVLVELTQYSSDRGVVLSQCKYAVNLVGALVQNLNLLILQSGEVLSDLGEGQIIELVVLGSLYTVLLGNVGQIHGVGGLAVFLLEGSHNAFSGVQAHVLLTDGLVIGASSGLIGVSVVAPYNGLSVDSVVDQLCSVLTRASSGKRGVYVVQQAVLVSQCVGLGCPACAYQASLLSVITQGYEQHLSSFLSSYRCVRRKDGVALTSNDAQGLAVLDVATSSGSQCR